MTRYVWRDGRWRDRATGEPMQATGDGIPAAYVMSDTTEFVSPLDFKTVITSRSQVRDLERRHGVRQVGTDLKPPPGAEHG